MTGPADPPSLARLSNPAPPDAHPTAMPAAAPLHSAPLQSAQLQSAQLNPADLDTVYTTLCQTLTTLGEAQAPLMLARLALLALSETADAPTALRWIAAAAEGLPPAG